VVNRTAISRQQMRIWTEQGIIEYLGETDDVRPYISNSHCVVLPSYREGLPLTLLEAAAMGRPIIATDVTGCREVVEHGVNGYLCKAKDENDLAEKMKDMINLSIDERRELGLKGRKRMEQNFDEKFIVEKIVNRIESVLKVT
jgi:glycosyltransferase involved in cell wall biosynthesis